MALSKLDEMKLSMYMRETKLPLTVTATETRQIADDLDRTCQDIGVFDPAYKTFSQQRLTMQRITELLEKKEQS